MKHSKNVGAHDRKDVADDLEAREISPEDFSQLISQNGDVDGQNIPDLGDDDVVEYLNNLSNIVHEQDDCK
jgi:hypothetical protein